MNKNGNIHSSGNITLIGMPGAGKSTLGVVLAKRRGMRFVDTDLLMQEGSGRLLSQIIAEDGIDGFLEYEDHILAGLECEDHVISTGGSACYGDNAMEHLRTISTVVFIDISFDEMISRLGDLTARGVAIRDGLTIRDLYEERRPLYLKHAHICIDTTGMGTREAVEAIDNALQEYQG